MNHLDQATEMTQGEVWPNAPVLYPDTDPETTFAEFVAEWEQFNKEWSETVEKLARQAIFNICPLPVSDLSEAAAWVAEINAVMPPDGRFDDDVKLIRLASEVSR